MSEPVQTLTGQIAIISGGLGDIGRAVALELARRGADVAIGDVLEDRQASRLLNALERVGTKARYDRADVADPQAVRAWISAVEAQLGCPNLILVNAAVVAPAGLQRLTPEEWSRELRVNLDGAFHLAQIAALRLLELKKPGRIVFTGSWAGHAPHPAIIPYCVAKAGLRMLSKCMALALAPHGIFVNEVAPGYVDAGLARQWYERDPALRAKDAAQVPVRKLIQPEDVARQVAHLCEPESQHITGSVLLMDGGLSLVTPAAGESTP